MTARASGAPMREARKGGSLHPNGCIGSKRKAVYYCPVSIASKRQSPPTTSARPRAGVVSLSQRGQCAGRISRRRNPPNAAATLSSFTEVVVVRFNMAAPIERKQSRVYIAMKRRTRPVTHACDEAVLERVDITIFDVARIISLVAVRCSQKRRRQMPRSLSARRTALRRSCSGSAFVNRLLISRQRVEKSQSPGGSFQIACR
jgi:hypothetical protein